MIRKLVIGLVVALVMLDAAAASADSYALIVTNNRSLDLGRPDLRYADDDGAKYYDLFTTLAPKANVVLLTSPDRDTKRLFPFTASAKRPTRANVRAAARQLAAKTRAAIAAGREVELYFVFAGHGDVDKGRGFLELADGPLDADGLAALIKGIPYTRAHVILDSCNSFFVINPRKAGGRRFATPRDAAAAGAKKLRDVGVFLSTSAEAQVFEWSALQSGIFSHAVRSGLSGAADANGDGRVTYRELEAFIHVAAKAVRNPLYRPKVYARGPSGATGVSIVDLRPHANAALKLDGPVAQRITVRDADDLPWIDVYKEAGVKLRLIVPKRIASRAKVVDHTAAENAAVASRGADALFRLLFSDPFGPAAYARFEADLASQPPPVFGIDREDAKRMELLLSHTAGVDRQTNLIINGGILGGGALGALLGVYMLRYDDNVRPLASARDTRMVGWGLLGVGAGAIVYGGIQMLRKSKGERIYASFRRGMKRGDDPGRVVAATELRLDSIMNRDRTWRRRLELVGWGGALLSAGGLVGNELLGPDKHKPTGRFVLGATFVGGIVGALAIRHNITPVERMVHIWRGDPGIQRVPRLTVTPTKGGASVGLSGTF